MSDVPVETGVQMGADIIAKNDKEAIADIKKIESLETLSALDALEQGGKKRVGVLKAIAEKRLELQTDPDAEVKELEALKAGLEAQKKEMDELKHEMELERKKLQAMRKTEDSSGFTTAVVNQGLDPDVKGPFSGLSHLPRALKKGERLYFYKGADYAPYAGTKVQAMTFDKNGAGKFFCVPSAALNYE